MSKCSGQFWSDKILSLLFDGGLGAYIVDSFCLNPGLNICCWLDEGANGSYGHEIGHRFRLGSGLSERHLIDES